LSKWKYELPVVCEIDENGYLKDEKTGRYIMDEGNKFFEMDQKELSGAVEMGLILL
jgi:hypothetical protein